jgi:sugar diacid utilization regulator
MLGVLGARSPDRGRRAALEPGQCSTSDQVVLAFLSELAGSLALETGASRATIVLDDTYLGLWTVSTVDSDEGLSRGELSAFGVALNEIRAGAEQPCMVEVGNGDAGRLVLLTDAPDSVLGVVLVGLPAPMDTAPESLLSHQLRAALFRSLIVSGVGRTLLTRSHGGGAGHPESGDSGSFENLIALCSSFAAGLVGAESAGIMLYDSRTDRLTIAKPGFGTDDESLLKQYCVSLTSPANSVRVFKTGQPYVSLDCLGDPRTPRSVLKSLRMFNVHQLLMVPLFGRIGPIGVINLVDKKDGQFSEGDVRVVQNMGTVIGRLIEDHMTEDRLRQDKAVLVDQLFIKSKEIESLKLHVSLTDALLSYLVSDQSGVNKMLARLSRTLNRNLLIYTSSGKVIGQSSLAKKPIGNPVPYHVFDRIGEVGQRMLILRDTGSDETADWEIRPVASAVAMPDGLELSADCMLLKPLRAGHRALGYLAVCGFDGCLTTDEQMATNRACTCIAAEMIRVLAERGSEEKRGSALVEALVDGHSTEEELLDVSRSLGRTLTAPFCAVVARQIDAKTGTRGIRDGAFEWLAFRGVLNEVLQHAWLMSLRENEFVAICSLRTLAEGATEQAEGPAALSDRLATALSRARMERPISIGIGPACATLGKIPASFNEARVAAILATDETAGTLIACAESLGVYRLLAQIQKQDVLFQFAERTLGPLLEHDRNTQTRYIETLESHLDCDCRLKQSSARLHIHANTLRYRLGRIQELLGCDVNDAAARLNLAVAMKALRLAEMLDGDSARSA